MEAILNRLRGTGVIFSISNINITGVNIYALYICILFASITNNIYIGILSFISFRVGESFSWGKWVGQLCYPSHLPQYEDKTGKSFPYIHYIANFIKRENDNYHLYCQIALGIRGLVFGLFIYLFLFLFGYISTIDYMFVSILYGIGFPLSCFFSNELYFNYKSKYLSVCEEWETMEVYYGIIHMICNLYIIWRIAL